MSLDAQLVVACSERDAAVSERDRLRVENEALRKGQVEARRHIALALRALNGDLPTAVTFDHHNGG
jgi:hypothetical protein